MLPLMQVLGLALLAANLPLGTEPADPDPIYGGEPTGENEFPSVVAFQVGSTFCSGTVVAPRLVITAAHCVAGVPDGSADITVWFGSQSHLASMSTKAVSWGAHPDFCAKSSCRTDIHDLGYLLLETDFVVPSYPAIITTQDEWDELMAPGTDVTLVGYGEDAPKSGLGIKRKVDVSIDRLTPQGLEFFAGGGGKDSCVGDSGGPAFARREDGSLVLAGVLSRGSDPCGDGGYYGAPYAGLCFIRDETGIDLVPEGCGECACLDTAPPEEGCGCSPERDAVPAGWAAAALLFLGLRHRNRRT